jgi:flagellin-like protein
VFGRLLGNRRGVSEVIASLILILVVTAAGVVIYSYSVSAFSSSGSHFEQQTHLDQEQMRERFQVIRVWWDSSTSQLNLTILNYGQIDIAVSAVYISGTAVAQDQFLSGRSVRVGVGELVLVKFVSPISIQSGTVSEILVVTERGGKNSVSWKA